MKRFEFRLDKVIDYRKKIEDNNKRELARAKMLLLEAENKLAGLRKHQEEELEEMSKVKVTSSQDIYIRLLYDRYLLLVNEDIESTEEDISKKNKEVELKREKLIESSKERRIVEKLKERRLEEFNQMRQKWEQSVDDEFAKYRFVHRRNQ